MTTTDERPYSPGLAGVLAGETALSLVDGANGRLLYRGYPIGELVREGSFAQVAHLLWADEWLSDAHLPLAPLTPPIVAALRDLPHGAHPMDALRTAFSVWGASERTVWPPTIEQAREITAPPRTSPACT